MSERELHQLLPVQRGKKQGREKERCRAPPSPSTNGSTKEDVSRDHSALAITYLPEQRHPTQLSKDNTEKSTDHTSFESHFEKTHSAGHKLKHEKELGQAGVESRQQTRKSEPAAASPNLDPKERLKSLGDDGLSTKQEVQLDETVPKTNVPVIENPEKSAKDFGVREVDQKERHNPISYWAAHHTWPENFAEHNPMASSHSTNKRQRTGKDESSRSYSQRRKNKEVPEQYTAAYERLIFTKGLDMDPFKGEELVSEESKSLCIDLQQITHKIIEPTLFPTGSICKIINFFRNRNEPIVNRDVTPIIVPSITSLYFGGDDSLKHVIDEVNAGWYEQCVLEGPRPRPDLAIGLLSSTFTEGEIDKLKRYTSVDNWTQVTTLMFFPFLMCEVKCGRDGLDVADRQNMHSCSVAVRALLRIEQEADKYRPEKKMEKKTDSLNGQVLVFSISHDQLDARLYGHYATLQGEKWTYYRYRIGRFDLTNNNSVLAIHNVVRNILKSHLPGHVQRLKDAIAALPDPTKPPESSCLPGSSEMSSASSGILPNDDNSQHVSQDRDADGFLLPPRPDSSQKKRSEIKMLVERMDKLMEENRKREERQMEENRKREERQRQEHKEEIDKLMQQLEEEREKNRESRESREKYLQRIDKLMQQLEEEREENRKREKRQRQELSDES